MSCTCWPRGAGCWCSGRTASTGYLQRIYRLINKTHKVQKKNRCFEQSKKLVRDTLILRFAWNGMFCWLYFHFSTANCVALHCLFANWMKFMRLMEALAIPNNCCYHGIQRQSEKMSKYIYHHTLHLCCRDRGRGSHRLQRSPGTPHLA